MPLVCSEHRVMNIRGKGLLCFRVKVNANAEGMNVPWLTPAGWLKILHSVELVTFEHKQ